MRRILGKMRFMSGTSNKQETLSQRIDYSLLHLSKLTIAHFANKDFKDNIFIESSLASPDINPIK